MKISFQKNNRKFSEIFLGALTWGAALLMCAVLIYIVGFIVWRGAPYLKPSLFSPVYNSVNVSLLPALVSTVYMTVFALALALPFGLGAAVYLAEYARRGRKVVRMIRLATETLAGIPSIIHGLFGMLFFVTYLGWGFSLLAGVFTLTVMILPLIMRASEEALLATPDSYREGAFALGAGKLRVVFRIVLPAAAPGVLAGVILAVGRIVGETAALIYTAGTVAQMPFAETGPPLVDVFSSVRTLSVHMYALTREGLHTNEGFATAATLLIVVIAVNAAAARLAGRVGRNGA
ncbi:MAG: phosphate ABC transporter permease PstA [Gracilibacteraceae bacterium]|jgi:phosphate transport system permease protein|nr:phosphate ABC transporter permease PstA [Gracilibacteraceae bacterium]